MESEDKLLQVSNSNKSTVSTPIPIPESIPVPVPTVSSVSTIVAGTGSLDIAFLINIIRGLENTIIALNKRLETYENAMVKEKEEPSGNHTESVHENEKPTKCSVVNKIPKPNSAENHTEIISIKDS